MTKRFDAGFFAGVILIVAGAAFLFTNLVPNSGLWTGAFFFALVGVAFAVAAVVPAPRWWPVIPAGVAFSLAATTLMNGEPAGGAVFLAGLGLTFVAVYLVPPNPLRRGWALIPAAVLILLALPASGLSGQVLGIAVAVALIAGGAWLLVRAPGRPLLR